MDIEQTKRAIAVMQHYAAGGAIQVCKRGRDDWTDCYSITGSPSWDWWDNDYRIKPRAPREFYVALDHAGNPIGVGGVSEGATVRLVAGVSGRDAAGVILVREIIE